MNEELKKELETLKAGLEGKSLELAKSEVKAFEDKIREELKKAQDDADQKGQKAVQDLQVKLEAMIQEVKEHANKLDAKVSAPAIHTTKSAEDPILDLISKNFSEISKVDKGRAVKLETKAVGDMSLANLTGGQPRAYSNAVATVPAQLLNLSDLVQAITIAGGTYTFPRETGSEGAIAAQTEGAAKSQIDYDITMIDVNTDFIAGYATYSKKMRNNLPFLESFLPFALRRDYAKAENAAFAGVLTAGITASTELAAGSATYIEQLMKECAKLEGTNYAANGIVVSPAAWWTIFTQEKSAGSGYARPGIVTIDGGVLRINGIPLFKANWLSTANKYVVGDWSQVKKVVTEGLSLEFSTESGSNFVNNNITARIESQCALAIERPAAMIYGDFTAV